MLKTGKEVADMDFGKVLEALKEGKKCSGSVAGIAN